MLTNMNSSVESPPKDIVTTVFRALDEGWWVRKNNNVLEFSRVTKKTNETKQQHGQRTVRETIVQT